MKTCCSKEHLKINALKLFFYLAKIMRFRQMRLRTLFNTVFFICYLVAIFTVFSYLVISTRRLSGAL